MNAAINREFYIPSNAIKLKTIQEIEAYKYLNHKNQLCGICFIGRAIKPVWDILFNSEVDLINYLNKSTREVINQRKLKASINVENKENLNQAILMVAIGDVFIEYSMKAQHDIIFWQVISKHGAIIELNQIYNKTEIDKSEGIVILPDINAFACDRVIKERIKNHIDGTINLSISNGKYKFHKWDGKPITSLLCQ